LERWGALLGSHYSCSSTRRKRWRSFNAWSGSNALLASGIKNVAQGAQSAPLVQCDGLLLVNLGVALGLGLRSLWSQAVVPSLDRIANAEGTVDGFACPQEKLHRLAVENAALQSSLGVRLVKALMRATLRWR